ncbi:MAG: D-alanine--D-alanine ligase family protein [Acidimicrobiales bacterium]
MSDRIKVVVLFGGQSAEHDVSCATAAHVLRALDPSRYDVQPIGITRDGQWTRSEQAMDVLSLPASEEIPALVPIGEIADPLPVLREQSSDQMVVLPLLHGPMGEDGTMQGLLELAGVPYVGCGVLGSALAMDKIMAKKLLDSAGVAQAEWRGFHEDEIIAGMPQQLIAELGLPLFVKPANMGSSVGVSKAHDQVELVDALALARRYDEWIVAEENIDGREIEVAVLGNRRPRCSVPGEIRSGAEFYSYEDKYLDGVAELVIPALLSARELKELEAVALRAYDVLRAEGMARVDLFYEADGRGWLLNEINTIPGFTPISMFPKLWAASGLSYPELLNELIELAFERHGRRQAKRTTAWK